MTPGAGDGGGGLSGLAIRRPIGVTMVGAAIVLLGWVSARELPVNLMPEIAYPTLTVRTELPGSAPEEVEKLVTEPIEQQLAVLGQLVGIRSTSRPGLSDVQLEFRWGVRMDHLVSEIREKLDQVPLPTDARRPLILRYDPSLDPILTLGVWGPEDPARLRRLAEEVLQRALEPLAGVAAVEVEGGLVEEIVVSLSEEQLAAKNLTLAAVSAKLASENLNLAGGLVRDGQTESVLRTSSEITTVEQIEKLVVAVVDGAPVRVRDLGSVAKVQRRPEVIARAGGRRAVHLAVYKEATANIVSVADEVRRALHGGQDPLAKKLEGTLKIEVLSDSSRFIRLATDEVKDTALWGGLLAMLVLYFFLGSIRHTLIIGLAIPLSVVVTFIPMRLFGVSLNVMSLGGLALGIGMLVDNSIVVLESIHRAQEEGLDALAAALAGTQRVTGAITASTLTTVAVFFPIVFIEGVAGQIFRDQAMTVCSSLMASLIVALAFVPMLAARRISAGGEAPFRYWRSWTRWAAWSRMVADVVWSARRFRRWPFILYHVVRFVVAGAFELVGKLLASIGFKLFYLALLVLWISGLIVWFILWPGRFVTSRLLAIADRGYPAFLAAALSRPGLVLGLLAAAAAGAIHLGGGLGSELVPEVHQGELLVHLELPAGSRMELTSAAVEALERGLAGHPSLAGMDARVGREKKLGTDPASGENSARVRLRLAAGSTAATEERLVARVRELARSIPHLESLRFSRPTLLSIRTPVSVEIKGQDPLELAGAARRVADLVAGTAGLADVRATTGRGSPELHLRYDRERLSQFGLDIRQVAETVRKKVHGDVATRVRWSAGEKLDLRVKLRESDLATRDALLAMRVDAGGAAVAKRLGEVATLERREGPAEIRHIGQQRATTVEARALGIDLGRTARSLGARLPVLDLPDGVTVALGGQSRELEASAKSLWFALGLALFLVYVVMACQFESLVQPLVVMLTVPMAAVGVVTVLALLDLPISVLVLIGAIVLAGIAVNNAIVLVDAVNQESALRAGSGAPALREAVLVASRTRLRPVLMTTLTTVLGLIPMTGVFGQTTGAELRAPLAWTLIAGLSSATLLTLVIIPVLYGWVVRVSGTGQKAIDTPLASP